MQQLPSPPDDELRRATHEAGHVVVALDVGWPFLYVTLEADARFPAMLGHVQYAQRVRRYDEVERWAATFLGGREAERLLLGSFGVGSREDERLVAQVIRESYCVEGRFEVASRALARAGAVIAARRADVVAVRERLIACRRLSADEVRALTSAGRGSPRSQSTR